MRRKLERKIRKLEKRLLLNEAALQSDWIAYAPYSVVDALRAKVADLKVDLAVLREEYVEITMYDTAYYGDLLPPPHDFARISTI